MQVLLYIFEMLHIKLNIFKYDEMYYAKTVFI